MVVVVCVYPCPPCLNQQTQIWEIGLWLTAALSGFGYRVAGTALDEHKNPLGDMKSRSLSVDLLPTPHQRVPQLLSSTYISPEMANQSTVPCPHYPTLKSWFLPKDLENGTWVTR